MLLAAAALLFSGGGPAPGRHHAPRPSDASRARALKRVAESRRPDAETVLVAAASDASAPVRQAAVQSIARYVRTPGAQSRPVLRAALSDPHPLVVLAAVEALHVHPDPAAAVPLSRLVRCPPAVSAEHMISHAVYGQVATTRSHLAAEAFRALRKTEWSGRVGILTNLLTGRSAEARIAAARALCELAGKTTRAQRRAVLPLLAANMKGPNRAVRRAAAEALAYLDDAGGTGVLMDWLCEPGMRGGDRLRAVRALERLTAGDWGGADEAAWKAADAEAARKITLRILRIKAHLKSKGHAVAPPDVFPKKLAKADRAMLDRLFEMGLFDPRGARRVAITSGKWTYADDAVLRDRLAWRVPAAADRPESIRGRWGRRITWAQDAEPFDFVKEIRQREQTAEMFTDGEGNEGLLVLAAWAYRLGHEPAAARLLFRARGVACDDEELLERFRAVAGIELFVHAGRAYAGACDQDALAAVELLAKVAGPYASLFGDPAALLAELARRKAAGAFGRKPRPLPKDLSTRTARKQVEYLIRSLEDVAVRQEASSRGVDLSTDPRVMGLIEIGPPAVEALIGCVRKDKRLTRSVHSLRTVLGAREAALVAVQSILRWSFFEPDFPADNFTRRGAGEAAAVAARLRDYWKANASVPLPRRMMNVLRDADSPPVELRVAAKNLAALGGVAVFGTMVGTSRLVKAGREPSPAAATFENPTAAEAILAAMDRDLGVFDAMFGGRPPPDDPSRNRVEITYIRALAALGDRRVVDELLKRWRAARNIEVKREWAQACRHLGRPEAMGELESPREKAVR